jgi:hypothetical protein
MLGFIWNPITKNCAARIVISAGYNDPTFHFIQWIGLVENYRGANGTGASDISVTSRIGCTVLEDFFFKELPSVHSRKTAHV